MLIHAPAAYLAPSALLGQASDGVILVVRAHATRRAVAQRSLEILKAAKVNVLGTALIDRRFPIPNELYRRL